MSEVKMSDVFKCELRREVGSLEVWEDSPLGGGDFVAEFEVLSQLEYSVNAINSYDANQKLITKQAARIDGQLKMIEVAGRRIQGLESEVGKQRADIRLLREKIQIALDVKTSWLHPEGSDNTIEARTMDRMLEMFEQALAATSPDNA